MCLSPITAGESSQVFQYAASMENTAVRLVCGALCASAEAILHSKALIPPRQNPAQKEFELFKTERFWMSNESIVIVHYGQERDSEHQARSGSKRLHSPTATGSPRLRGVSKPGGPHHRSHAGSLPAETKVGFIQCHLFTLARISRHCLGDLSKGEPQTLISLPHACCCRQAFLICGQRNLNQARSSPVQ